MLNVAGDEPDTKKLRKSHSTVTHLTQHASVQGALKRSLYPFAALALWATPYLASQYQQFHKKIPAPAIWMEPIGALLVSSKVHETETVLICSAHTFFTRVGTT